MNKFKKVLLGTLSVLTLGLFVVTGAKVNAGTIVTESFSVDSNVSSTSSISAGTKIYDGTVFSVTTGGGAVTKTNCGAGTVTSNDNSGLTYTAGLLPGGGSRTYEVKAIGKDLTVKFYYTICNGDFSKSGVQTKGGDLQVDGTAVTSTNSNASNVAYMYSTSITSGNSKVFGASSNRLIIFGVVASYEQAGDDDAVVTFNSNGGSAVASETVSIGSKANEPTAPTRQHYNFVGWYTKDGSNDDWGDEFNFDTTISSSITLYAKWEEKAVVTVNYYVGDTKVNSEELHVDSLITYEVSSSYVPSGKYFSGWCTDSSLASVIAEDYKVPSTGLTLYAKFTNIKNYISSDESIRSSMLGSQTVNGFAGSIFNFTEINVATNSGFELPTGNRNTYRLETSGSSSATRRNIKFTAPFDGKLTLWVCSSNSGRTMDVYQGSWGGTSVLSYEFQNADKNVFLVKKVDIVKDAEYIIGGSNGYYIYGLFVEEAKMSDDTTAAVFAEKNTAGDTLRFVGTLTGITDLANIDSIELLLAKDTVAASPIALSSVFTSVTGASKTCAKADGTYYTIFRLTGIDGLAAGTKISKQLKVTFTDGSTTLSDATDFTI